MVKGSPQWNYIGGKFKEYPFGDTKTGVVPSDLRDFAGVPLVIRGQPSVPLSDKSLLAILRWAEDKIEQQTGILLCPTWVCAPPARTAQEAQAFHVDTFDPSKGQQRGFDYDLEDAPYDFKFNRAQDDGWFVQSLRYRPLRILDGSATAIKQMSFVYPLLNEYYDMPTSWIKEDLDNAFFRIVPSVNVQSLPIFALQLTLLGQSETVPGAIALQYTAGLESFDYRSRFSLVTELVLAEATIKVLGRIQGSVNMGLESHETLTDGVQVKLKYVGGGAYSNLIEAFTKQRDELLEAVIWLVGGPRFDAM